MGPDDIEIVFENYETGQRKPTRKPDTARLLPKQSNLAPEVSYNRSSVLYLKTSRKNCKEIIQQNSKFLHLD